MKQRTRICPYNDWIICTEQSIAKCRKCGWNPREQRRRKAYDPPPALDEEKAREFLEEKEIQRWRERTFGKTEEEKK